MTEPTTVNSGERGGLWPAVFGVCLVAGAAALVIRPLFSVPLPDGHDALPHAFRLVELDGALRQGVLYPRWFPEFFFGYGYPLFSFMPPFTYYVAELFHLSGLPVVASLKAVMTLGILASGLAMFLFVRDVFGKRAAAVSAVAYVLLPYLLFDIYVRMAVPEAFAFLFLPLTLWAVHRALTGRSPFAIVGGALAVAGLALTHNPSALLFIPFSAVYAGFLLAESRDDRTRDRLLIRSGRLFLLYALGLGLSAFLWLPSALEQKFIWLGNWPQGDRHFFDLLYAATDLVQPSFFYRYDESSPLQVHVGLIQAALAGGGAALAWWRRPHWRRLILAVAVLTILPLFLMTRHAAPLWEMAPTMTLMSFPSRLLMFVGFGTAILTGLISLPPAGQPGNGSAFRQGSAGLTPTTGFLAAAYRAWPPISVAVVALLLTVSALKNLAVEPLDLEAANLSKVAFARYEAQSGIIGTTTPAQLVPTWVKVPPGAMLLPDPGVSTMLPEDSPFDSIQLEEVNGWRVKARVTARREGRLLLHAVYFPGWHGSLDGLSTTVEPEGPLGLVSIEVPEGEHTVDVAFGDSLPRQIGNTISALAALLVAGVAAYPMLRRAGITKRRLGYIPPIAIFATFPFAVLAMQTSRPGNDIITPLSLMVGRGQDLIGWQTKTDQVGESGNLDLTFYWHVRHSPKSDQVERIRLTNENGRQITEVVSRPDLGNTPTTRWLPGEIIRDRQTIALPAGTPSGRYSVELALSESAQTGDAADGQVTFVRLGEVQLPPPAPVDDLPAELSGPAGPVFDRRFVLRGMLLDGKPVGQGHRVKPGDRMELELLWQALTPVDEDYAVFLHLSDRKGQNLTQVDSYPPGDLRFTSLWRPGAVVHQRYWLTIPEQAATGVYDLASGLYSRSTQNRLPVTSGGSDDRAVLTRLRVERVEDAVAPQRQLDARFASGATLLGWTAGSRAEPAKVTARRSLPLSVTLHWRAEARIERDYTVFVHLIDREGRVVAQIDREPLDGRLPTSAWQSGDRIADQYEITIPADLSNGEYQLLAGMYDARDMQRSPVSIQDRSDNQVAIGLIEVTD